MLELWQRTQVLIRNFQSLKCFYEALEPQEPITELEDPFFILVNYMIMSFLQNMASPLEALLKKVLTSTLTELNDLDGILMRRELRT